MSGPAPPQNLEAEESVLGAMILAPRAIVAAQESGVTAADFYRTSHGTIFEAACALHDQEEPVDAITLADALQRSGDLDKIGGQVRLHELANLIPDSGRAGHYSNIVREMAALRRLIAAGQEITRLGYDRPGNLDELVAKAEAALTEAVSNSERSAGASIAEGLDAVLAEIRAAYTSGRPIMGRSTGFSTLDAQLAGFWPGQLILLAARPSVGKSALALNLAENVADRGESAMFFSLEMSRYELQIRSLARAAGLNSMEVARGAGMRPDHAKRLGAAVPTVTGRTNLIVDDDGTTNVANIRAEASRVSRQGELGLIVVDYLQLMQGGGEENRTQEVSVISRGLKQLARKLEVPILALSQMSRNIEHRAEKRPLLSDLRESGSLEQDADVVLFLHSDAAYDPSKEEDGTIEIIVAKQRKGPTGTVRMAYNRSRSAFKDLGASLAPEMEAA